MTPETIPRSHPKPRARWLVPGALILLSLVPVIAGAVRLTDLVGGRVTRENTRFFDSPVPVLIHIPAVTLYLVLGAVFYDLPPLDGPLLLVFRLVFGSAMVTCLVLGFVAVRRRNYVRHSEWMSRAYAIGIAQGTIVVVTVPWILLMGPVDELTRALLIGASWVISLLVAEFFIYRRAHAPEGQIRPTFRAPSY
ncbi:DUF2306 domain-containing protein [Arthrobacter sp. UKPF54-2]|uniref:DUF2306 domain-containing protein n=1 Tax=Arthrobacter sp. UKPF54-2 TaxID=2600159 RepID=UPI0011B16099|nr:DUF2306 domain-containing protein [Arthrobacter sp. UKPF54-2]QDY91307.1 DUF2306 domain-containing protein [Arthrobacter sp. UKPF54-2]